MKKFQFKNDHRYLNIENAKHFKSGDIIEWYFDTQLNGRKSEKVRFVETTTSIPHNTSEKLGKKPALMVEYLRPEFMADGNPWPIHALNDEDFVIWTNGFNPIRIESINGMNWDEYCQKEGLNIKSYRQQECEFIMAEVNRLKSKARIVDDVSKKDYEEVYLLHEKIISELAGPRDCEVAVSVAGAFSNILRSKAYLTTTRGHRKSEMPTQRLLNTISFYVPLERHKGRSYIFIYPGQDIEGKKQKLNEYVRSVGAKIAGTSAYQVK